MGRMALMGLTKGLVKEALGLDPGPRVLTTVRVDVASRPELTDCLCERDKTVMKV